MSDYKVDQTTAIRAVKRANRQTIASFDRNDRYFYEEHGILEMNFHVLAKEFAVVIARRLKHRLKYDSNSSVSAVGKVLASQSFLDFYRSSIKKGYRSGDPIKIRVRIVRRHDRVPGRRWVMWVQLDEVVVQGDGESVVVDAKKIADEVIDKAQDFAAGIKGDQGKRIRAYLNLAQKMGYPKMLLLWHYYSQFVGEFGIANAGVQEDMKKSGGGRYPLKGEYFGDGHNLGLSFRVFPIRELVDLYRNRTMIKVKVQDTLMDLDDELKKSLSYVARPFGRQQESGGGTGKEERPRKEFRKHILNLFKNKTHLYYIYDKNTKDDRSIWEKI